MNGKDHVGMSLIDMEIQNRIGQNILNYHNEVKLEGYSKKERLTPRNIRFLQYMIMRNIAKSHHKKSQ